ncbi:CaiB/BaiF CoA transferase family protein [Hoyosella subflava]|uniref:L-carnitine dehydratase/bile acid-inducible protein F n=1 Tax=Hoyosella subflava (strain DSM 45089 / JCM 17490 / NBRC 109087 / DQS3-9A1) TaxID=443218 RepID=F6EI80_HOYSD|nr:CoA transferase [Hoyosella subflava]AEF41187.1 L-carnitine dehydratase/bile acid-inducible protein F [Hoyosella subflava DQS3-9A1]
MSTGALDGVIVADFSRVLAGPYATMLLGDLGAEVIKIERPGSGDDTRAWGPPFDQEGTATYFNSVNRNKKSVVLDLSTDEGRSRAREIVAGADVVVENFRAGTMERLGLGYEELCQVKPDVIYCAITGFGRDEGAALAGYDLLVQAVGGLMSITGPEPGSPTKVGVAVVDVLTGLHALAGIQAALFHRQRTGEGQRIDINLLSSLLSSLVNQASGYLGADVVPSIMGNRHPSIVPYEVFPTADRPLAIAVGNDKQFAALCRALGMPEVAEDPEFSSNQQRVKHRDELFALLSDGLAPQGADYWFKTLTAAGVPAGPINNVAEAIRFAESLGLAPTVTVPGTQTPQVANPIQMSGTPPQYRSGPPRM